MIWGKICHFGHSGHPFPRQDGPPERKFHLESGLRLLFGVFGFRHSGDATHASGRQGVRDAEPNGRFGISTTLDPPVRSGSRGFRRLRPIFLLETATQKLPWLVLPAPSGPRAEKKAQATAPVRGGGRGMSVGARGVLQTALMGLITALGQRNRPKWTSRAVSRRGGWRFDLSCDLRLISG